MTLQKWGVGSSNPALFPPVPGLCHQHGDSSSLSPVAGGLAAFRAFLQSEHSEENIEFWLRCKEYKQTRSPSQLRPKAMKVYVEFISVQATQEVGAQRSLLAAVPWEWHSALSPAGH